MTGNTAHVGNTGSHWVAALGYAWNAADLGAADGDELYEPLRLDLSSPPCELEPDGLEVWWADGRGHEENAASDDAATGVEAMDSLEHTALVLDTIGALKSDKSFREESIVDDPPIAMVSENAGLQHKDLDLEPLPRSGDVNAQEEAEMAVDVMIGICLQPQKPIEEPEISLQPQQPMTETASFSVESPLSQVEQLEPLVGQQVSVFDPGIESDTMDLKTASQKEYGEFMAASKCDTLLAQREAEAAALSPRALQKALCLARARMAELGSDSDGDD